MSSNRNSHTGTTAVRPQDYPYAASLLAETVAAVKPLQAVSLSTEDLLHKLKASDSLSSFLCDCQEVFSSRSISAMLTELIEKHGASKSEVAKKAGISWVYLYQILTGRRHPSRNRIICIGLAISCTLEEIQTLLNESGHARLNIRNRRDAIIIYSILHGLDVFQLNDNLFLAKEETL